MRIRGVSNKQHTICVLKGFQYNIQNAHQGVSNNSTRYDLRIRKFCICNIRISNHDNALSKYCNIFSSVHVIGKLLLSDKITLFRFFKEQFFITLGERQKCQPHQQ